MMRIFSVDPGLSGGWAVIIDGVPTACGDMPVAGEGSRRRVAATVLANRMREANPGLVVVELAGAMPKQGVATTFRFGVSFGTVLGVAGALALPFELVSPVVWKRHHHLIGLDKEASRAKALDLAPAMASMLDRSRDHGRAEAILIGLYAVSMWAEAA